MSDPREEAERQAEATRIREELRRVHEAMLDKVTEIFETTGTRPLQQED